MATEDLQIQDGLWIPGCELQIQASLSGGPGGQHVNTTHSRITLRWHVESSQALSETQRETLRVRIGNRITNAGFIVVHCGVHRQQLRNIQGARQQLTDLIRLGLHTPKRRRATRPTRASQLKRVDAKKKRGQVKQDRRRPSAD